MRGASRAPLLARANISRSPALLALRYAALDLLLLGGISCRLPPFPPNSLVSTTTGDHWLDCFNTTAAYLDCNGAFSGYAAGRRCKLRYVYACKGRLGSAYERLTSALSVSPAYTLNAEPYGHGVLWTPFLFANLYYGSFCRQTVKPSSLLCHSATPKHSFSV